MRRVPVANNMRRIGVLWSGDHLFPKVAETIDMLRSKGRPFFFSPSGMICIGSMILIRTTR